MLSSSPFYTLYNAHQAMLKTSLINSHFSRSFTSVIISYTQKHQTLLHKSVFSNMMSSAIMLANNDDLQCFLLEDEQFVPGSQIKQQKIYGEKYTTEGKERPYFKKNCGNITITECEFHNCHSKNEGGSLHIQQDCTVLIHDTIFDNTSSSSRHGGAVYLVKEKKTPDNYIDFIDDMLSNVDIQYCCFQDCYADEKEKLYGIACFIAGNQTILYYASTVNCPGIDKSRNINAGAQFDIQAINVTSKYVNATGGYSKFCAAIEYRTATDGFFKFQTISDMDCMFAVSYTSIDMEGLDLSLSNIMNVTLKRYENFEKSAFSGLIHVRKIKTLVISDFSFIDNSFNENDNVDQSRIISKGYNEEISVTLINCYYSCDNSFVEYNYGQNPKTRVLVNCHPNEDYTNDIPQLDLGECKGRVTPAPLIPPTAAFSESNDFSKSNEFSKTNQFSYSNDFTKSNEFSKTSQFSYSNDFTKSNEFSKSNDIPEKETNIFSNSKPFTKSKIFSNSIIFSQSDSLKPLPLNNNSGKGKDKNVPIIAGVVGGVAAAAIIAALAAFFIIKKKRANIPMDEDVETITDSTNSVNNVNPIFDNNAADDPFKEDFNA